MAAITALSLTLVGATGPDVHSLAVVALGWRAQGVVHSGAHEVEVLAEPDPGESLLSLVPRMVALAEVVSAASWRLDVLTHPSPEASPVRATLCDSTNYVLTAEEAHAS